MSRNAKRWIAFLGAIGFTTAFLCFTLMLSGKNCPAYPAVKSASSSDLPPCHRQDSSAQDETAPNCSSCHFEVSQESVQPKSPDLHPIQANVLSALSELLHSENDKVKNFELSFFRNRSLNPQKFVLLSIASVRILT
ncbi:hypothetical protein [Leptospira adleri]|uniref:hypothetical protein n=1 Tax=Leptospira adleri TaxID=2023186 RepID=UPI0010825567|nr:hypothetical protein [Leptospira adleri]TGM57915.1 hypothetical protein EHQ97_09540 [Leptospira adleri]